ncbi:hypothetical protein [Qipengyuania sp. MTN3-11]|uniref:hypothetical protein n=1 Tax=Qipengyuania sp. MTN3-11 TaxID=3056557 RepID=UPI0036F20FF4
MDCEFAPALLALVLGTLMATGCSAPAPSDPQEGGPKGTNASAAEAMADVPDGNDAELPAEFVNTAWRAIAEDGARYTTFLDEGGRYRDLRNGDPWQEGGWEIDSQGQICFLPDAEGAVLRCWHPDRMQSAERMIASSDNGMRIRLERVDYSPPADAADG